MCSCDNSIRKVLCFLKSSYQLIFLPNLRAIVLQEIREETEVAHRSLSLRESRFVRYFRGEAVILLAVLALATVAAALTGANAQTAYKNSASRNLVTASERKATLEKHRILRDRTS